MSGRRKLRVVFPLLLVLVLVSVPLSAQEQSDPAVESKKPSKENGPLSVEALADRSKPSIAVILHTGRQGKQAGLGAGFVIDADGLIATNYHVIGDGRPITVQFPDGSKHDVTEVRASDRHLDLAVLKIDAKGLKPLPLETGDDIKDGQAIVVLGHPLGLKHSVVAGVLSGRRDVEGVSMLQVALPIEPGNSGGPVLNMSGKVVGIVSMKSLVTPNLGFAIPVKDLQGLLKRPNPVPMSRWVTLGRLDPSEWQTEYAGNWRQRAGRILVDGQGTGFGGRSLCFFKRPIPKDSPYEIAVNIKLDDEKGAAGLIFGGDGVDKHFGFYPSGGKLRLTKFGGPDVFQWKILHDAPSEHYRPGEWNTLKVHLKKDRALCYVNGHLIYDEKGIELFGANLGLAKFRETKAEFKKFQVAPSIDTRAATPEHIAKLRADIAAWKDIKGSDLPADSPLRKSPSDSLHLLRERALQLEKQAEQLRKLAQRVHQAQVLDELAAAIKKDDADTDLLRGALLIAKLDNEDLDVDAYVREVDRLAREIAAAAPKKGDEDQTLETLNTALFKDRGFHGSRHDFYARNNSYLNEVIDDREGLPITLAVLYMEIARRLGLNVVGLPIPGHFVVRYEPMGLPPYIIDVFEGGKTMTNQEAMEKIVKATGAMPKKKDLTASSKKSILIRMLHNLINVAEGEKDSDGVLRYLDAVLTIDEKSHRERLARAVMRMQAGQISEAIRDCDYLIDNVTEDEIPLERVQQLRQLLQDRQSGTSP